MNAMPPPQAEDRKARYLRLCEDMIDHGTELLQMSLALARTRYEAIEAAPEPEPAPEPASKPAPESKPEPSPKPAQAKPEDPMDPYSIVFQRVSTAVRHLIALDDRLTNPPRSRTRSERESEEAEDEEQEPVDLGTPERRQEAREKILKAMTPSPYNDEIHPQTRAYIEEKLHLPDMPADELEYCLFAVRTEQNIAAETGLSWNQTGPQHPILKKRHTAYVVDEYCRKKWPVLIDRIPFD